MQAQKETYPQEDELVLCTVTKIQFNSVFVNLNEYNRGGMIHISEVSPGRIRNIRDYVKEGKKIICKVLRVNPERGHIDLSLRRVTESQRRQKSEELKFEQKAEKIIELIAQQLKKEVKEVQDIVKNGAAKEYQTLHQCFAAISRGEISAAKLHIPQEIAEPLDELVKARMKPAEIAIKRRLVIQSYQPEGIEDIKGALKKGQEINKEMKIAYEGGGRYKASVVTQEFKSAEKIMEQAIAAMGEEMKKKGGTCIVEEVK